MSRQPSTTGLVGGVLVAGSATALGAALLYRPSLVLDTVPALGETLAELEPTLVVVVLTLLLVVLAPTMGFVGRVRASSPRRLEPDTDGDSGSTSSLFGRSRSRRQVGSEFATQLEQATAYDESSAYVREQARENLVESLRGIAAEAYAAHAGTTRQEATQAIRAGTWTADQRAAILLAGDAGPSTPLSLWLYDLFTASDPFERSVEHTIAAIASLQASSGGTP